MVASPVVVSTPTYLIDLHGIKAALSTTKNSVKSAVIDAIQTGKMRILKSVSRELKENYPNLYNQFKLICNKKYVAITVAAEAAAASLTEEYGSSILGSIPSSQHFTSIAVAGMEKLKLVSSSKGYADCKNIVKKCKLNSGSVLDISDL